MHRTIEQTSAIVDLIQAVTDAAGIGLTRGDTQLLLLAGRHADDSLAYALVSKILDPRALQTASSIFSRTHAVVEVARAANIETIRMMLV